MGDYEGRHFSPRARRAFGSLRSRVGTALLAVAVLAGAVASGTEPAVGQAAGANVRITSRNPDYFSPNGDGSDDLLSVTYCLDTPANLTVMILDGDAVARRTIETGVSHPAGCFGSVTWDGRDDAGALLPDGDAYFVVLRAVDSSGATSRADMAVDLDRRVPGQLTAPTPGASLAGTVQFAFTPTPGFDVSGVRFSVSVPQGSPCQSTFPGAAGADGIWRAGVDTVPCGAGPSDAQVQVLFNRSGTRSWSSPLVPVTLANPTPPKVELVASPLAFSPNGDGQEDELSLAWCTADRVDSGDLTLRVRVVDADGTVVRRLVDEVRPPAPVCQLGFGYFSFGSWDGRDDAGHLVADGDYRVEAEATDTTGLTGTDTVDISLDARQPGRVSSPPAGASLSGVETLAFTPTPGVDIDSVQFVLTGAGVASCSTAIVSSPDGDGVYRADLSSEECGEGARDLHAEVRFRDRSGNLHGWFSAPVPVTLANAAPPTVVASNLRAAEFSPNGDGQEETVDFAWCVADNAGAGTVSVRIQVVDATGSVTRVLLDESRPPAPSCQFSFGFVRFASWDGLDDGGAPAPDGAYRLEVVATDAGGLSTTEGFGVVVNRRLPGNIVAPAPGAALEGTAELAFAPAAGFDVGEVRFVLAGPGGSTSCSPGLADRAGDGSFRLSFDSAACGEGGRELSAFVVYQDPAGSTHRWTSPPLQVTLANPIPPRVEQVTSQAREFSPNGDNQEDSLGFGWCAADAVDGGDLAVGVRVVDQAGAVVRVLRDEARPPTATCDFVFGNFVFDSWDGLDDAGAPVPDGPYRIDVVATDPGGLSTTKSVDVAVDRRGPGLVSAPLPGATLVGTQELAFTPTPGFAITQVFFSLAGRSIGVFGASPDGVWRTTHPMGGLPPGLAELSWSVSWTDRFGGGHGTGGQIPVAIDPTAIPLQVDVDPASGPAPLHATITVRSSDPQTRPLAVEIDFGDGTDAKRATIEAPYAPLAVEHTFDTPGTYPVFVSVSNGAGGATSQTVPVAVAGAPNTAPSGVAVATTPSAGNAPLDTLTTVEATDAEGDPLSFTTDFGDGTAPVQGTLPTAAVPHRYGTPGVYVVRTEVTDGQLGVVRTGRVTVSLSEPLAAAAGDDRSAVAGDDLTFDASGSRPAAAITSYEWDFGDGTGATEVSRAHSYGEPGTYTVTLTVRSGAETAQDTATVVVLPVPREPGLAVTITSGSAPLPGAEALVVLADGSRVQATADGEGRARLRGLPNGDVTVYAWADGFQPAAATARIADGVGDVTIALAGGEVGATQLTSRRLTIEEIQARGIDPTLDDNSSVYEFEVNLFFVPVPDDPEEPPPPVRIEGLLNLGGFVDIVYTPGPGLPAIPCVAPCSFSLGGSTVVPRVHFVGLAPVIQWLVIPGNAKFLKEFFDVSMVVQNLASPAFTFTGGAATLELPAGLKLAPMADPQSATVDMADIPGGSSRSVTWTVRGDAEGNYDLAASYSGVLDPIGQPVRLQAQTAAPLRVWGGSALEMVISADRCAARFAPYHIDVTLRNVTTGLDAAPVYNADVQLLDRPPGAPDWQAEYWITQITPSRVNRIDPGTEFTASWVVFPGLGRDADDPNFDVIELEMIKEASFVRRTGGDASIPTRIEYRDNRASDPQGNPTCRGISTRFKSIEVLPVDTTHSPNTADVKWFTRGQDPEVEYYELLTSPQIGVPLDASPRFPRQQGTSDGRATETLTSDRDRDVRYVTVRTHLTNGEDVYEHPIAEGPPRYVALGDSFSAGEGYPPFELGTHEGIPHDLPVITNNHCHRSLGSYSRQLSVDPDRTYLRPTGFHACSGAITNDYDVPNPGNDGEPPQREQLNEFVETVTVTMGGNDVGFKSLAICVAVSTDCGDGDPTNWEMGLASIVAVRAALAAATFCVSGPVAARICAAVLLASGALSPDDPARAAVGPVGPDLQNRLQAMYRDMLHRAPHARILVGNYPQIMDDADTDCVLRPDIVPGDLNVGRVGFKEKRYVRQFANALNGAVQAAVSAVGDPDLTLVNVNETAFKGHELCIASGLNPSSGANSLVLPFEVTGHPDDVNYSFHPNSIGQGAYAEAFREALPATLSTVMSVAPNQVRSAGSVQVAAGDTLRARAGWTGSDVGLQLVAPDGTTFTRDSLPAGATWTTEPTTETVAVPGAAAGDWQVAVVGLDVPPDGEQVTVSASALAPPRPAPSAVASTTIVDVDARTVRFDATGSSSANGDIVDRFWVFGDGTTATGPVVEHTFAAPGTYPVALVVTDAAGETASTVLPAITFAGTTPVAGADAYTALEDQALSPPAPGVLANDVDADGDGDPLTAMLVTGPAHGSLALDPTGAFTYTPAPEFSGTDTFSYTAGDGTGSPSEPATVTILVSPVADAPVGAADRYDGSEDDELVVSAPGVLANDADADGDALSAILATGPAHGTLALAADGSFRYTPTADFAGDDSFTYVASDGALTSAPVTVQVTVAPVDDPPAGAPDTFTVAAGETLAVAAPGVLANDTDADGDALAADLVMGPEHGVLDLRADGSFDYEPDAGFTGTDGFNYAALDATGRSPAIPVRLDVTGEGGRAPAAADDTAGLDEDTVLELDAADGVLANDTDPDGDTLTAELVAGPTHGQLDLRPDGSFTYRPDPDRAGEDSFSYRASDGALLSAPATVTITVAPVADTPVAEDDAVVTEEDRPLAVAAPGVLANDHDGDGDPLSASLVSGPAHGEVSLAADGSFTYTPASGFSGADSFTYTAGDGGTSSDPATVTIAVAAVNDAPEAQGEGYAGTEGQPLQVLVPGVLANDRDPDGDPLTAMVVAAPATGTLALAADGSFTYTPAPGFSGVVTFAYVARDATAASVPATVTLTIAPANFGPTLRVADGVLVQDPNRDGRWFLEFAVSLSEPAAQMVTVHAETEEGTATVGDDFDAVATDLRFPRGTTTRTVRVRVHPDTGGEGPETLFLVLGNPSGATIADGTAVGTIPGDVDVAAISVADADPVTEPARGARARAEFTVSLAEPARQKVTVHAATVGLTATSGQDFKATATNLTFNRGQDHKTVTVDIVRDGLPEGDEQFQLVLSEPQGAVIVDGTATATIRDG
jgi:PKD repeat protein/flagellar hook assembly protein FlgD